MVRTPRVSHATRTIPSMSAEQLPDSEKAAKLVRRSNSRLRVRLPARLVTRTETLRVVLRDISLWGASIAVDRELALGLELVVEWGAFDAFGEVVWSDAQSCGIRFIDPISPDTLMATRELDDHNRLPRDSDLLRQIARGWAEGSVRL